MRQQLSVTVALAVLAAGVIAGAQTRQQTPTTAPHQQHSPAPGAQHNMAMTMTDAQFVPMMIQHHRDGIEMARVAEQKAATAEVKALAAKIRAAQERDVPELQRFQKNSTGTTGTAGQDEAHAAMMREQSQISIARVRDASGKDVDRAFLEEMASHHQMAIDMVHGTKFQNSALKQKAAKMAAD